MKNGKTTKIMILRIIGSKLIILRKEARGYGATDKFWKCKKKIRWNYS